MALEQPWILPLGGVVQLSGRTEPGLLLKPLMFGNLREKSYGVTWPRPENRDSSTSYLVHNGDGGCHSQLDDEAFFCVCPELGCMLRPPVR